MIGIVQKIKIILRPLQRHTVKISISQIAKEQKI